VCVSVRQAATAHCISLDVVYPVFSSYLRRCLASGEGTVVLGVRVSAEPRLHAALIAAAKVIRCNHCSLVVIMRPSYRPRYASCPSAPVCPVRARKITANCHVYLDTGSSASGSGVDCKLGLRHCFRPSLLLSVPEHETLGNWTDGRIPCRHSAATCFLVIITLCYN